MMRFFNRLSDTCAAATFVLVLLLLLSARPLLAAEKVFESDFQRGKVPTQWSFNQVEEYGNRQRYLGPLSNQTVHLRLEKLPPHALIRIHFDLIIAWDWVGTWLQSTDDERSREAAVVQLAVQNGPVLMRGTFSNTTARDRMGQSALQSFPELDERIHVASRTGARDVANFAVKQNQFGLLPQMQAVTATLYQQNWTFPHQGKDLILEFSAENLLDSSEQFWGLDNVVVEVLSADEVAALDKSRLDQLPKILGDRNSLEASVACWDLIARPEQALLVINKMKTELLRADTASQKRQARIHELVRGLDSPIFADRVEAQRRIEEFGAAAAPTVAREVKAARSPETRERLRELLAEWAKAPSPVHSPQALQRMRCTRILEIINTESSRELAKQLRWE